MHESHTLAHKQHINCTTQAEAVSAQRLVLAPAVVPSWAVDTALRDDSAEESAEDSQSAESAGVQNAEGPAVEAGQR